MYHHHTTQEPWGKKPLGFTLVELAIVLAVTGVLFVGLYRLLSGGNQQVKDTAAASQQIQLINAVKTFLGSSDGVQWMGYSAGATGAVTVTSKTFILRLPDAAHAPLGTDNSACYSFMDGNDGETTKHLRYFCDALPAGFSTSTVNAYGQVFNIQVQTGLITAPAQTPTTYSFMIMTTGGEIISDPDGGRIVSQIGTDGGFIYSAAGVAAGVCTASTACGAFGAWKASPIGDYGFLSAPSGHIASRTYYAPEIGSTIPWLARNLIDTTTNAPPFNTMHTDLFLGGKKFYLGSDSDPAVTTGGGTINLQNGLIQDKFSNGGAIFLDASGGPNGYLSQDLARNPADYFITLNSQCTNYNPSNLPAGTVTINGIKYQPQCQFALGVGGDANVNGQLQAGSLYAGTFIYQSSDLRLKTDIHPIPHALDDIMRIKPVAFAFKAGGEKSLGVIAQDMEAVYPQLVFQGSNGMKSVNYDGLVAPLIASVQELKKENDELRSLLKQQIERQNRLEKKIDSDN